MRLHRPYVDINTRLVVAERLLLGLGIPPTLVDAETKKPLSKGQRLKDSLQQIFSGRKYHLHHDPALCNRPWNEKAGDYEPPANDPDHLFYVPDDVHDIITRVSGQHGQLSDLAIRRKRKRQERKQTRTKRRWPSRPLRNSPQGKRRSRWLRSKGKGIGGRSMRSN
jgi:hypothetical protein